MDDKNIRKYLLDIDASIDRVNYFLSDVPREFEKFAGNILIRQAIERNIEIMGEAMNRILKIYPEIAIANARKIVDARNYVIHAYDSLSADILWSIVINHLPLLKSEVEVLLRSYEISSSRQHI